jgi:trimethylamine--corrinoid protein Co-methyltransferase
MLHLNTLDTDSLNAIHSSTLNVLANTGIVISHQVARDLLLGSGAFEKDDRILIPENLVEKCLSSIPEEITIQGRDPKKSIKLGAGEFHSHNVGGVPNIYDPRTNTRRRATRRDNVDATRLLDKLPNVSSITPLFTPQDVPVGEMSMWMIYDALANTTKAFRSPGLQTGKEVHALWEIVQIICPHARIAVGVSPVSPLTFPDDITEAIMQIAKLGFILGPLPCPILGATAPMTIAGGLVQQNAEVLASLVLGQLVKTGTSILYKGRLSVMNPYTGLSVWGNPEIGLISTATVAIGHFYGIPVDVYGFCTNAHQADIQNGYERAINALLPALSGADEISGIGEMDSGVNSSLAQILIDNEILSSIHRICDGIHVDDDRLGADIIHAVMDGPRNYLSEKHTIKYLRAGEVLTPALAFRNSWTQWEDSGQEDIALRAEEKAISIVNQSKPPELTDNQKQEVERVIKAFVA